MKTKLLKLLVVMTISITAIFALGMTAGAEMAAYNIAGGDVNITAEGDYSISGSGTDAKITIDCSGEVNIKFDNLSLKCTSYQGTMMEIKNGTVNIELDGENILQAHQDSAIYPCVSISEDAELHFYDSDSNGSITIHGTSNYHGGGAAVSGGSLYVHSGSINLVGGNKIQNNYGKSFDGKVLNIEGGSLSFAGGTNSSVGNGYISVSESLVIGEGASLTVSKDSTVEIMSTASATINGTVINNGDIVNSGIVNGDGEIIGNPPYNEIGSFIVTGGINGTDYEYATGVFTIKTATPVTIANKTPQTPTTDRIEVADGVSANITLAGVNIDVSSQNGTAAFQIAENSTGNVTIILADGTTNTLKSGSYSAGLQKNGTNGSLTIQGGTAGTGILNATGSNGGSGIGGSSDRPSVNIIINGGNVTAISSVDGAGIGGGYHGLYDGSGSNITISGGTVTAIGGPNGGAGIGGGYNGIGSNITISGGSVKAVAGTDANAIGGGKGKSAVTPTDGNGNNVYLLTIANPESKTVYIDNVEYTPINHTAADHADTNLYLYLTGTSHTVKVGDTSKVYEFDAGTSTFIEFVHGTQFSVSATNSGETLVHGVDYTYPTSTGVLTILSDKAITIANKNPSTPTTDRIEVADGVSANITLAGVNIDVSATRGACAFKIADNSTGDVTIILADNSENTLKSGTDCAGLQKNGEYSDELGTLTIQDGELGTGKLIAQGGRGSAGIGGGDTANILINGGNITAKGASSGVGIGGFNGNKNIKISGGVVHASTAEDLGLTAIGSVFGSAEITISGGTVTTVSGFDGENGGYAPDIGSCYGSDSIINITGGSIKINSGNNNPFYGITPTDGNGNNVYLLELAVDGTSDVTINGKAYPKKHFDENKVYIYLPAKTAQAPNEVTVGNETTKYCYINAKWLKVVDSPEADDTEFTYDGTEKTYTLAESENYTITGNTAQTTAGTYTVTVALNDKVNTVWNDGTTNDKTFTFTIAKATVTVTAKSYTIKVSETLPTYAYDVTGLVNGETLPIGVTISCNVADSNTAGTYDIIVSGAAASDNYSFSYVNGTLTVSEKEVVAAPTFTPASGTTFTSTQNVTIACATDGATIYYTTDGSTPTTASTKYTGAITITSTTTIKAIAVKDGMGDSSVVTAKYTKNSGGSGSSGGGSGGGGGYRPPVVPDDDDDDNDDVVVNDPEDNEDKSDNGNEPQIKGDNGKTGWDAILDELDDADEGDKIVVDMNGETEVPEDVFEQIKGQDIDLVIELDNGFIWTINGKDVTNPADIDLGVNKGSTIPVRVINAVTGECEYITITLTHNGEFGFKVVLTVDMGVKNEGYFANLYWYTDNDTKFICADKIDNKGRANLVFTHASEYVIVIDENDHTPEDDVSAGAGIEEDSSEIPDDFDNDENPYTGVAISFAGIIISAATIMIARKRKKQ